MDRIAASVVLGLGMIGVLAGAGWATPARPPHDLLDKEEFRPVDTSKLMGSPDPIPPLAVELAFPSLPKFTRPVALGSIPGTDRMWVITQDGVVFTFPKRADVKESDL